MKRVLVTGGADGIGRALVSRYAEAGADVTFVDVDAERGAALRGDAIQFVQADLADRDAVDALSASLAEASPFDVVIQNAGISHVGPFDASDLEAQQRVIRVNLEAPLVLTAALLTSERVAHGGAIAFVSSLSHYVGYPGAAVYAATKDGLASYARSLSVALASRRILVSRVFPGPTRTAHAERYSPEGSDASKRMSPDAVAKAIERGLRNRRTVIVPGVGARLFALAGSLVPRMTERALRRALYEPLAGRDQRRA